MISLGDITNSEYDLMGAISDEELLGALERATPQEKKRFVRKVKQQPKPTPTGRMDSRAEFEKRINLLPQDIQQGLANKTLQAVDVAYYSTKSVAWNKVVKMLKDDDNKVVGMTNISSAKLEKGNVMLLNGIILLGASNCGNGAEATYDIIPDYIRNGEFEFKANGTTLVPLTSCEVFNTAGTTRQKGLFKLDNPKIIYDQQAMELNIEWAKTAVDNQFLRAILVGTAVIKY